MDNLHLIPLEQGHAREILGWRYPAPYDFYNPPVDQHFETYVSEFVNPLYRFHAVLDRHDEFVGFCSFGIDGQVPGGDYQRDALDIGLGMHPDLTGNGQGRTFFEAILRYGIDEFEPDCVRLTVADFNVRAIHLYENFGFQAADAFIDSVLAVPYTILLRNFDRSESKPYA